MTVALRSVNRILQADHLKQGIVTKFKRYGWELHICERHCQLE